MTRTEALAMLREVLSTAGATIDKAAAGGFSSSQEYEREANDIRRDIAALIGELDTLWGVQAWPAVSALRALAARFVDLHRAIADTTATVEVVADRETSFVELAVSLYGDGSRWTELAPLNPGIRHPGFIAPGTTVVARAR